MISGRIIFLFLFAFFTSVSVSAQDLFLCYGHDYQPASQTDTLKIYIKGNADTTIRVRAANVSIAFHDSCAVFDTFYSYFTAAWSLFFERSRTTFNLSNLYNGRIYTARFQYGNSDPGIPMPHPIAVPASNDSLLIFKFVFRGSCSQKLYIEDQRENILNQLGDEFFNPIDYAYYPCQGRDSIFFCIRQAHDSLSRRDSLRLYIKENPQKRVAISEVNFSVAFRDSCAQFDSLHSALSSLWGDTLAYIKVQDSLQLSYRGNNYDSRLIYRHQHSGISSGNLLQTPAQSRFPEWLCTMFFSGSCSQDIYLEKQADQEVNFLLNSLDEPLLYSFSPCDSLPEDTLVLDLMEDLFSGWKLYPNPVTDQLFIVFPLSVQFRGKIQLLDISGKLLLEKVVSFPATQQSISLTDLPPGFYLIKVAGEKGEIRSFKFIKE